MVNNGYTLSFTPQFMERLVALPADPGRRVWRRVKALRADPRPDGNLRVRYHGYEDVYRLKVPPYRILYRWEGRHVTLLTVGHRRDIYRQDLTVNADAPYQLVGDVETPFDPVWSGMHDHDAVPDRTPGSPMEPVDADLLRHDLDPTVDPPSPSPVAPPDEPLSPPITPELLDQLGIVDLAVRATLLACHTEGQLLDADLPDELFDTITDALWPDEELDETAAAPDPALDAALDAPTYIVEDLDEFERAREGEPLQWRLRLDPEQEEIIRAIAEGPGPFFVRGGPGSGKTTVALHAVRSFIEAARARGIQSPCILYVTYTRSLANTAQNLLRTVVEPGRGRVVVRNLDSLATRLASEADPDLRIVMDDELEVLVARAREEAFTQLLSPEAAQLQQEARVLAKLSNAYLLEEIEVIIEAQEIDTLEQYLAADRRGRGVGLRPEQRAAVWRLRGVLHRLLAEQGLTTWALVRRAALQVARNATDDHPYDAVIVDEVQDLNPLSLQIVFSLCPSPEHLLLVGDTGQSIHPGGFHWQQALERFSAEHKGWTLRKGHRGTADIHRAASAYLAYNESGARDSTVIETHRRRRTKRRPVLLRARDIQHACADLAAWLREAMDTVGAQPGDCAVLVPTNAEGWGIADRLQRVGLTARFIQRGQPIDFANPSVSVMTWHNAKGHEYPIVAVLSGTWHVPRLWAAGTPEEEAEIIARWRRAAYVAMTRATEALAVVVPTSADSPLLDGLGGDLWDVRECTAPPRSHDLRANSSRSLTV